QMPRLGSAIASTILSVLWAVSLVGVDKAQAAVLRYDFQIENGVGRGFFTVDSSSLTGIGYEEVGVSEGILNTPFYVPNGYHGQGEGSGDYLYLLRLGGVNAVFYRGDFLGLQGSRSDEGRYKGQSISAYWSFDLYPNASMWTSRFSGSYEESPCNPNSYPGPTSLPCIKQVDDAKVSYTPVPEPLTAGGTALALAGLSWLKHKKKKAA
ncbi:MAG: PEP-CTERM sorting domain-containing protein, partial [Microcoleus sp. T1-bin1]|nr:PEP-CTERM sorting domain-containing protein [Microcoleus sp. T1-bin1]